MITTIGDTVIAEPVVPAATGDTTTNGGTSTGNPTTVTTVAAGTVDAFPSASTTAKLTDFNPASAEVNVTDSNNARYSATVADPVNVNTPPDTLADTSAGNAP
ncbi:hypothetical protein MHIP_56420 [Mycolicibacterium hippocampi]|uniref:Uncharacterized protein n=1 Tax=Mycolicibacterium hippocampi TaxID=659824 RepID=A0A7I9ZWE7_9MYCO|nr:hypothetical protein MHIP_56420 [Mycolicibacterium hippocampi]